MIWYLTHPRLLSIREVEITRFTKESVWERIPALFEGQEDMEKKQKRHSEHSDYWPNGKEAVAQLKKQAEKVKSRAEEELAEANEILKLICKKELTAQKVWKTVKLPADTIIEI